MKGSFACLILALAFIAGGSTLTAQEVSAPTVIAASPDSALLAASAAPVAAVQAPVFTGGSAVAIGVAPAQAAASAPAEGGIKGMFFGTKTRTSNTMMIGGVGLAAIGVAAVKGEVGAVMGVAGLLTAIGGLYVAYR